MATYKYKVRSGDTPTTLASRFRTTPQAILKSNPGVNQFSTGLTIRIPAYLPRQQAPTYATGQAGVIVPTYLPGYNPAPGIKPAAPVGPSIFQKAVSALTGQESAAFANRVVAPPPPTTRYQSGINKNAPVPTSSYGQFAAFRKASSAKYNTVSIQNEDGTVSVQPRTVSDGASWTSDVAKLAGASGMSRDHMRQELQAQGYVQYGNQWIYNGPGASAAAEKKQRAWYGFRGDKWRINKRTGQVYSVAKNNGRMSGRNSQSPPDQPAASQVNNFNSRTVTWRV